MNICTFGHLLPRRSRPKAADLDPWHAERAVVAAGRSASSASRASVMWSTSTGWRSAHRPWNGIGGALLEDLHRRHDDASRFEVSTAAANVPALALNEQAGYRIQHTTTVGGLDILHVARLRA